MLNPQNHNPVLVPRAQKKVLEEMTLSRPLMQALTPVYEHLFDITAAVDVMNRVRLGWDSTGGWEIIFLSPVQKIKKTDNFWDDYLHIVKEEAERFGAAPRWLPWAQQHFISISFFLQFFHTFVYFTPRVCCVQMQDILLTTEHDAFEIFRKGKTFSSKMFCQHVWGFYKQIECMFAAQLYKMW